ncbi:MAG: hypothetical protein AAB477_02195 [Patescibacteria group bacterium]
MADVKSKSSDGGIMGGDVGLWIVVGIVVVAITIFGITEPLFSPDSAFNNIADFLKPILVFLTSSRTWIVIGIISSSFSILCIAVIIFSLVRMREIQIHEKKELDHEIQEALLRDKETSRNENPRWHYILTLMESSNESDWRVAIIEADTMLDEALAREGIVGETLSEKLEQARTNGYAYIQNAWDAHLVRNQIAHAGSEFSLSQVEGRRVVRLFQTFFEEIGVI